MSRVLPPLFLAFLLAIGARAETPAPLGGARTQLPAPVGGGRAETSAPVGGPPAAIGPNPSRTAAPSERPLPARRVRLKDLAAVSGVNSNSLTGYGLVAGLPGTGDSSGALTSPMTVNLLQNLGLAMPTGSSLNNKNLAVVAVTAELPPVARSGDPLNVRVSSLGDARSLEGGTLLLSLLKGPDGKLYASAQGPLSSVAPTGDRNGVKAPVAGAVIGGGVVCANLEATALSRDRLVWRLFHADYAVAARVASAISARGWSAVANGPQTVEVWVYGQDPVRAVADMGELEIEAESPARVVCDLRTGTIVASGDVRLRPAVVSHRGATVEIGPSGSTLTALVESLRQGGASPADIVAVLQALSAAGSLDGEVVTR